jgi:hypothetical protein
MYANTVSKAKKLQYERTRRAKNRIEKKEAQVLKPWLKHKYKNIYAEFTAFYGRLKQDCSLPVKNLTKSKKFKEFLGMFCIMFLCYVFVYVL